jgi:hypothetical protein
MAERSTSLQAIVLEQASPLLLPEHEAIWLGALVAEHSVQGDPRRPPGNPPLYKESLAELGELEAVRRSMLNPYDIHATCEVPGRLALVRKMSPHGAYEMTVMAQDGYDGVAVDTLFGFEPAVRKSFYDVGAAFAEFSEGNGLYPVVSYTYDPLTHDRKAAQSVKIFHMQLTARSSEELEQMAQGAHPLAEHSVAQRRQLIDESSVVYSLVLADYFAAHPIGSLVPIPPFSEDGCSNLRFRVGDNWSDVQSDEFDQNLRAIHTAMNNLYADFANATMSGQTGDWERPVLSQDKARDYIEGLAWMQPSTKEATQHFIAGLRVEYLQRVEMLKRLGLTAHVYPLAGFCYGAAVNKNNRGELMLSIRPQQFADTGGTGLQYIDPAGAHVKMDRGSGMYNEDELAAKVAFEQACVASIVQNVERVM